MNLPFFQSQNVQRADRSHFGFRYWVTFPSCPIFTTVLSLSLAIGFGAGCAASATSTAAKHKAVKSKSAAPAPAVQAAPVKAAPPEAILPPNRIHNMMLPVPTITERLIRDIMVGKPQETAPPAGTEAFSNEAQSAENSPAANSQPAPDQSPHVAPAQSASDTPSQPSAPSAETPPTGEAPAGMAPDAVVPLKPELKPEETDKPQEKSQLPFGKNLFEAAVYSAIPASEPSIVTAEFAQSEPEKALPEQCAAPALGALLGDTPKQPTATTTPEGSSNEFDSAGATSTTATAESQAATLPLAESPRERIAADGLEGATYAIKTNGGFGSSMVSRQSIPIETAIRSITGNGASSTARVGEEVDLDSAVAPATAAQETGVGQANNTSSNEPVVVATPPTDSSSKETVMDAAASDDHNESKLW